MVLTSSATQCPQTAQTPCPRLKTCSLFSAPIGRKVEAQARDQMEIEEKRGNLIRASAFQARRGDGDRCAWLSMTTAIHEDCLPSIIKVDDIVFSKEAAHNSKCSDCKSTHNLLKPRLITKEAPTAQSFGKGLFRFLRLLAVEQVHGEVWGTPDFPKRIWGILICRTEHQVWETGKPPTIVAYPGSNVSSSRRCQAVVELLQPTRRPDCPKPTASKL